MSQHTLHPQHLRVRGSLRMLQGWLLRDRQRVLQGRYEVLLGEIGQVRRRAEASTPRAQGAAHLSAG